MGRRHGERAVELGIIMFVICIIKKRFNHGIHRRHGKREYLGKNIISMRIMSGFIYIKGRHLRPTCGIRQRYTSDLAGWLGGFAAF